MEINPLVAAIQAKQAVERKPTAGAQVAEPQKTFEPSAPAKPRDKIDAGTKLNVSRDFDERSNRAIFTITNQDTGEVVNQMPADKILNIAAKIRDMLDHVVDETV